MWQHRIAGVLGIVVLGFLLFLAWRLVSFVTSPSDPVPIEEIALDTTDLIVLRAQEANRERLKSARFRSRTTTWFRETTVWEDAFHRPGTATSNAVGVTTRGLVLESHWQHWFLGDMFLTSGSLTVPVSLVKHGKPLIRFLPYMVRTVGDDFGYRVLQTDPTGRRPTLLLTRGRKRRLWPHAHDPRFSSGNQRGDWHCDPSGEALHRMFLKCHEANSPGSMFADWTSATLSSGRAWQLRTGTKAVGTMFVPPVTMVYDPTRSYERVRGCVEVYRAYPSTVSIGTRTTEVDVREVAPGLWFPVAYRTETRDTTGTLLRTDVSEIDMSNASFNRAGDVTLSELEFELPPGTDVDDERYGMWWQRVLRYGLYGGTQSVLRELSK